MKKQEIKDFFKHYNRKLVGVDIYNSLGHNVGSFINVEMRFYSNLDFVHIGDFELLYSAIRNIKCDRSFITIFLEWDNKKGFKKSFFNFNQFNFYNIKYL